MDVMLSVLPAVPVFDTVTVQGLDGQVVSVVLAAVLPKLMLVGDSAAKGPLNAVPGRLSAQVDVDCVEHTGAVPPLHRLNTIIWLVAAS